jgi:CHAT domain-containing protein
MIVSYKDPIPYESVVVNDNAKNWDDAHFLIENIEVTRIYNSYRFFRDPQKSLSPRIQFVQFNQSGMDDIPFTQSWANQMREDQEASILQANERPWLDVLSKPGIVHLFGHGKWQNSNIDFPKTFFIPAAGGGEYLSRSNLDIGPKINLDLLVLQHCYSGKEDKYIKHYDTQLFQNMLYLGAGAVVSSITAITDESSAWIMDEFYRSMKNGMTATQALCNAKRLYLSSHHGSGRDPRMWAALTLTSNVELVQEEESIWYRLWKWLTGLFQ